MVTFTKIIKNNYMSFKVSNKQGYSNPATGIEV